MPLTDDDVAYMRATQADARPSPGTLRLPTRTSDGRGGTTTTWQDAATGTPITVRIQDNPDVPQALADRYQVALVKITTDLVDVPEGAKIDALGNHYQVVSVSTVQPWTTALVLFAQQVAS